MSFSLSESAPATPPASVSPPTKFSPARIALIFASSLVACLAVYLILALPGRWFSPARDQTYRVPQLTVSRGAAERHGDDLVVAHPAQDGNAVISVNTDLRAVDYPVVAWFASDVSDKAKVALLWRTDVEPARLNTRQLDVGSGRILPLDVHADPHWVGRILGLALVIQGPLDAPIRVQGVAAKPSDAFETLRDRVREWFAPEPWNGATINTVSGGAEPQSLPLPLLLACGIAVAVGASTIAVRRRVRDALPAIAGVAIALALASWFILDARWLANVVRHTDDTAQRYAGKDERDKHLAADDGPLYAFIDKALRVMPNERARVFVVADADFFRGRAAYHLYPHNVWFDPYHNALPPADKLHAGDWLVVFQRRGVQYDAALHRVRWAGDVTVPAEIKLLDHGNALFEIQ